MNQCFYNFTTFYFVTRDCNQNLNSVMKPLHSASAGLQVFALYNTRVRYTSASWYLFIKQLKHAAILALLRQTGYVVLSKVCSKINKLLILDRYSAIITSR